MACVFQIVILQFILLFYCDINNAKPNSTFSWLYRRQKAQEIADEDRAKFEVPTGAVGPQQDEANLAANRFTAPSTKPSKIKRRTTPMGLTLEEHCDYLSIACLHAYRTGKLCARTLYYNYQTFKNYCIMDFVNCMEKYEVWQVVHMGECFNLTEKIKQYIHYQYHDDFFLDQYYVIDDF